MVASKTARAHGGVENLDDMRREGHGGTQTCKHTHRSSPTRNRPIPAVRFLTHLAHSAYCRVRVLWGLLTMPACLVAPRGQLGRGGVITGDLRGLLRRRSGRTSFGIPEGGCSDGERRSADAWVLIWPRPGLTARRG